VESWGNLWRGPIHSLEDLMDCPPGMPGKPLSNYPYDYYMSVDGKPPGKSRRGPLGSSEEHHEGLHPRYWKGLAGSQVVYGPLETIMSVERVITE